MYDGCAKIRHRQPFQREKAAVLLHALQIAQAGIISLIDAVNFLAVFRQNAI
jgi:hypothetical protein